MDAIFHGNISGLTKWEPLSRAEIFIGHSKFRAGSVALVLNPETGHVSTKVHMVFDDEYSTVPFMREGKPPPNWIDIVQCISKSVAQENI